MRTRVKGKISVAFITLGCSKNLVDSEKIMARLPQNRFKILGQEWGAADILVINTCGFIKDAKEESIETILQAVNSQKEGRIKEVVVTGCLSQRYKSELSAEIPEVDAWFGARGPEDLLAHLNGALPDNEARRIITTPSHYAYLKIAEGCDRTCSFCAIPLIRGGYRSIPPEDLVKEAKMLSDGGVRELILIAQDLSYYGIDIYGKPGLERLLPELSSIEGIDWIRLHYAYPHNFPDSLISMIADNEKICNYLDIPLQHISDNILRSMRRGHDRAGTYRFLRRLREGVPGIALRTTLMVGYPGETEREFMQLLDFVREFRFERLGVFTYSPEEGTRAFALGDTVAEKVKKERATRLMQLQSEISLEINTSRIGDRIKVLIDSENDQYLVGRTEFDSPEVDNEVHIEKAPGLSPGQFLLSEITGASEFDLYARPV